MRWKLWIFERSRTVMTYVPAFTVYLLRVIVNPGPSVAMSFFAGAAAAGPANAMRAAAQATASVERMTV
jgi:hypothetical protein